MNENQEKVFPEKVMIDFKYFVKLAIQKEIPWKSLTIMLIELTTSLDKSKKAIRVLVQELEKWVSKAEFTAKELTENIEPTEAQDNQIILNDVDSKLSENELLEGEGPQHLEVVTENQEWTSSICNEIFDYQMDLENPSKVQHGSEIDDKHEVIVDNFENGFYSFVGSESDSGNKGKTNQSNHENHVQLQDSEYVLDAQDIGKESNHIQEFTNDENDIKATDDLDNVEFVLDKNAVEVEVVIKDGKNMFQCRICSKIVKHIKEHMRVHLNNKTHNCKICSQSFNRTDNLHRHEKSHDKPMQYKCCSMEFKNVLELRNHKEIHLNCKYCGKSFESSGKRWTHERIHEKTYLCKICKEKFSTSNERNLHRQKHWEEKRFKCQTCNKRFKESAYLNVHKRTHTGEKPYSCKSCEQQFSQKTGLKQHERIHSGEVPFGCKYCNKRFRNASSVVMHERRYHTGERPYKCKICEKLFVCSNDMKSHLKVHTSKNQNYMSKRKQICTYVENITKSVI